MVTRRRVGVTLLLAAATIAGASASTTLAQPAPPPPTFEELADSLGAAAKQPSDVAASTASRTRSLERRTGALDVDERERADRAGGNDKLKTAERIRDLGTSRRVRFEDARISGTLADVLGPVTAIGPFAEDDGAIPLANPSGISIDVPTVRTSGAIGDGPHGSADGDGSGDFDFYAVNAAAAGQLLTIDVDAQSIGADFDPVIAVTDASGAILAFNDDSPEIDSFLELELPADGDYFVGLAAFGSLPTNPFDSGSGQGATSEGSYELTLSFDFVEDIDVYRVDLRRGDVLGASVVGAARVLELIDPTGALVMGSGRDQTIFYPDTSPLRVGGNATIDHVAAVDGPHFLTVSHHPGAYEVDIRLRRPGIEAGASGDHQILFLDFDGAFVDPSTFGTDSGDLSPMADFLAGWGLGPEDEDALIDAIVATYTENLRDDPHARGGNDRFDVEIRTSRDHPDPWGQPNVSRVVIGGTREELDFDTIGLAPGVDPGNFAREETAVVLLDQASAPAGSGLTTINDFVTPGVDMIALVGRALGFVASHETGHILGDWHTAPNNGVVSIMDTFDVTQLGLGPDFVFGTADDVDVDFVTDEVIEGLIGAQDTLARVAFALSTPPRSR